jgi:2-methylisocitrate lyase-like PEP mutase family enzyme
MNGNELIVAPCALNPIMARIAEDAGFKAVYMSGGSLGWLKCVTEANLALPELAEIAVDMRAVCKLPIILDGGGGWGDPMHVHRTIALTEAADLQRSRSRISCCRGASSTTSGSTISSLPS